MRTALYARVSTERQERYQTIDSQIAALRAWATAQNHAIADEHIFRDEGYSGSRLDRPGLDALRDAVRDGVVGIVAVLTPDRLARKYAYQVLLLRNSAAPVARWLFCSTRSQTIQTTSFCCRSRARSPNMSAPFSASASGVGSCRRPATDTTRAVKPLMATATYRAKTSCPVTLSWTRVKPPWCDRSTAGSSTNGRRSARSSSG